MDRSNRQTTPIPQLKLIYFDFHGGRAEPARLAFSIGGVPFEDHRFPVAEFGALKEQFPFRAVPVLEVNGEPITQSNSITRYAGRMSELYPDDPLLALQCDEVLDAVEDIVQKVVATFHIANEEEKRAARVALAEGPLTLYLSRLGAILEGRGGEYFVDGRLTVADLRVFVWVRALKSGILDDIPTDLADKVAPVLVAHGVRVASHPGVKAYYAGVDS